MKTGEPLSADALGRLTLFSELGAEDRKALAAICTPLVFDGGEAVVREGDTTRDLYVLTEGAVRVSKTDRGEEQQLAVIEAETVFGELSLVLGEPRSATVASVGQSSMLRVDGQRFLERQQAGDVAVLRLAWTILVKLAARQSAMNREILNLSREVQQGSAAQDDVSRLRDKLFAEWSF